jgi:hypothetical protein
MMPARPAAGSCGRPSSLSSLGISRPETVP